MLMEVLASALLAFCVGAVPVGLIVNRVAAGIDIREFGTGNIGASNTLRNVGFVPAAVIGVAAFAQGFLPAWVSGREWGATPLAAAAVGAVAGYIWSPLLGWRGGSAVGTATGALAAIDLRGLVPLLVLYALGGLLRQPAPGVLAGLVAFALWTLVARDPLPLEVGAFAVLLLVVGKRLDGAGDDLHSPDAAGRMLGRLIFDRRPGRPLVGRAS
jgi:acyl phosphate:glycerol-3-phosphate acyltransferase